MLFRLVFVAALVFISRVAAAAPPNIVLLLSDDQAWTDFGFMGHPHLRTPHLDKLSRESLTFTRGYVPDSLCRPSLMTLLTGRFPHQHGIVGNDPPPPPGLERLTKSQLAQDERYLQQRRDYIAHINDEQTWPGILRDQRGYRSLQTGKWWEGNYQQGGFTHGMSGGDPTRGGRHGDAGLTIGRKTMEPVYDFIKDSKASGQPFFVWYAPMLPHSPHNPPERLLAHYRNLTPHLEVAKYWAMCEWYDETCGELLAFLDEQQLAQNTIVISITDNGWINEPDADRYAPRSKRSQYDGGIRTPIMIRWPGRIPPRMETRCLASSIDLLPTVLAATEIQPIPELPGINLLDEKQREARHSIQGEILEHDVQHMTDPLPSLQYRWLIHDEWKLIVPNPARVADGVFELYHVTRDPFEETNLAGEQPKRVQEMIVELDRWWPAAAGLQPAVQ